MSGRLSFSLHCRGCYLKSKNYIFEFVFISEFVYISEFFQMSAGGVLTKNVYEINFSYRGSVYSTFRRTANPIKVNSWHMTIKGCTGPFIANKD
ncbi:hypothetical protein BpHYR1_031771 [Brachionus plicatilis]|uniref:Uncharacterized protein n=1 Tax=Brachionus plicatilis TaxID=10195 RepID=A0A3M7Q8F2_BRAPC|nr:hypothetical protein BpHYR1_031771 [Brachionus plicatilis]